MPLLTETGVTPFQRLQMGETRPGKGVWGPSQEGQWANHSASVSYSTLLVPSPIRAGHSLELVMVNLWD